MKVMPTSEEVKKQWPDSVRLKMIERSEFYENPHVYQYGFYDGYQMAYHSTDLVQEDIADLIQKSKALEEKQEFLNIMMALVRTGYNQAASEILNYCLENKVTEQFTNFISEMLNEKNKKAFAYEVFKEELNEIEIELTGRKGIGQNKNK